MPRIPPDNTGPVRDQHRFDVTALGRLLHAELGSGEPLSVHQFRGGQSNPTFWISDGDQEWVLRKKPPGRLLPSAHAVDREHAVIAALQDSEVPVPRVHLLCEDSEVIGTAFYVMEHVRGRIFWDVQLPGVDPAERTAIYDELARVLAALHQVDPSAVGLSDYGRPDGYLQRQVSRWTKQYRASETQTIPTMDALIDWLPAHLPATDEVAIAHGDYRLDNHIIHPTEPRALALIDWELSTLGHPLADLAYTCMLYDVVLPKLGGLAGVDFAATGIPDEAAFVARYCALTGRQTGIEDWPVYKAFSLFRLAAIVQGVYKRSLQGNASSEDAGLFREAAMLLSTIACRTVGLQP